MTEALSQIELTETYKIGIEAIDQEHVFLIGLYNELIRTLEGGVVGVVVDTAVNKLFDYADFHFASEERLMWVSGYPGLEQHKSQHDGFVRSLEELVRGHQPSDAVRELAQFVGRWIRGHILVTDKAFGEFIAAKGQEARAAAPG